MFKSSVRTNICVSSVHHHHPSTCAHIWCPIVHIYASDISVLYALHAVGLSTLNLDCALLAVVRAVLSAHANCWTNNTEKMNKCNCASSALGFIGSCMLVERKTVALRLEKCDGDRPSGPKRRKSCRLTCVSAFPPFQFKLNEFFFVDRHFFLFRCCRRLAVVVFFHFFNFRFVNAMCRMHSSVDSLFPSVCALTHFSFFFSNFLCSFACTCM